MFEEALSLVSTWTSMTNWFTPTFLFLFLNFMIATIFFTSSLQQQPQQQQQQQQSQQQQQQSSPSQITRAPSLLHRLKSINFYSNPYPSAPQTPSPKHKPEPESKFPDRVPVWAASINEDKVDEEEEDGEGPTLEEIYSRIKGITPGHNRQKSDTLPFGGDIPVKLPAKIRKSASDKSAFNHFEGAENAVETENVSAAVAVAEAGVTNTSGEVDAMADDFISRFKKQLQLQRVESIMRYKDMITRGSAKLRTLLRWNSLRQEGKIRVPRRKRRVRLSWQKRKTLENQYWLNQNRLPRK